MLLCFTFTSGVSFDFAQAKNICTLFVACKINAACFSSQGAQGRARTGAAVAGESPDAPSGTAESTMAVSQLGENFAQVAASGKQLEVATTGYKVRLTFLLDF